MFKTEVTVNLLGTDRAGNPIIACHTVPVSQGQDILNSQLDRTLPLKVAIQNWIDCNTGDFQDIIDYEAYILCTRTTPHKSLPCAELVQRRCINVRPWSDWVNEDAFYNIHAEGYL